MQTLARAFEFEQLQRFGATAEARQQMLRIADALFAEVTIGAGNDQSLRRFRPHGVVR